MNQQPNFSMVPVPWGFPQTTVVEAGRQEAPARVKVAVEFLQNLSFKTMSRAAVNDISIEQIPGQALTTAEANAQATACNMLVDYFAGKLKPSTQERAAKRTDKEDDRSAGVLIRCVSCGGGAQQAGCQVCMGSGSLLAFPAHLEE